MSGHRLTPMQRYALELISAHPESATCTTEQSWEDRYTAFINHRTADALRRRGFITIDSDGQIELVGWAAQILRDAVQR
jgi:hypothetical protein